MLLRKLLQENAGSFAWRSCISGQHWFSFKYMTHGDSHTLNGPTELGTPPQKKVGVLLPSGKLTWQWNIPIFNRKYIFNGSIFHCYVSLPECNINDFQQIIVLTSDMHTGRERNYHLYIYVLRYHEYLCHFLGTIGRAHLKSHMIHRCWLRLHRRWGFHHTTAAVSQQKNTRHGKLGRKSIRMGSCETSQNKGPFKPKMR